MVNKKILYGITIVFFIAIDQITKYLAESGLILQDFGWFAFNLVHNTGASFGIFKGGNVFLIFASLIVFVILVAYHNRKGFANDFFFVLILSGLFGNLIDRIIHGYVIDFFDLKWFPVFNVADSLISIGVVGLIITEIIQDRKEAKKNKK